MLCPTRILLCVWVRSHSPGPATALVLLGESDSHRMRAEQLCVEDNLPCPMCKGDPFFLNFGDDFRSHLVVVHQVQANFNIFMEMAVKKKMSTKKEKKPEEIELGDEEESDPDVADNAGEDDQTNYINVPKVAMNNTLNPLLNLDEVTKAVNESMMRRFSKLVDIFEGKTAFECQGEDLKIEDDKKYEEELSMAFVKQKLLVKEKFK